MPTSTIPETQNRDWGFFGTVAHHAEPTKIWNLTFAAISTATSLLPDAVRAFLDSKQGRHFADAVAGPFTDNEADNAAAINATVDEWMGWRIGARTARETGIPRGLPYLTGYVLHAEIKADTTE